MASAGPSEGLAAIGLPGIFFFEPLWFVSIKLSSLTVYMYVCMYLSIYRFHQSSLSLKMAMPPPGFSREQFYELSQRQQTPGAGGAGVGGGAVPQCWQRPGMAANSRQAPYQGQLEQQQQQQQQRQLQHQRQQQQLQQQQQQIRGEDFKAGRG